MWFELVLEEQENLGSIPGLAKWVSHPRHKVEEKKLEPACPKMFGVGALR